MATRVAVVTGANKGVGFGITRALCKQFDGDVLLTSRSQERGLAAVAALEGEGLRPKFHQLDIDDDNSIQRLKEFLSKTYGGLDVLVNNAAMAYKMASTVPVLEQAQNTVRVNFFALRNVCHALFPLLRPHARVVNVSSAAGVLKWVKGEALREQFSSPKLTEDELVGLMQQYFEDIKKGVHDQNGWPYSTYATSKVAVNALTFMQQREFDKDSREDLVINAVHPGYVDTDLTNHKGELTIDQGADAPSYLALLPPNVKQPRGQMVWFDREIVDWILVDC